MSGNIEYAWYPPPRSTNTGHRVSDEPGLHPIKTSDYPWWPWWPLEFLMRVAARKIGRGKVPMRLINGLDSDLVNIDNDWETIDRIRESGKDLP